MRRLIWLWTLAYLGADQGLYLGVQEPPVPGSPKDTFEVRVAFRKQQGKWIPMPHLKRGQSIDLDAMFAACPKKLTWTAAFDGRQVLSYNSLRPKAWAGLAEVGTHKLSPGSKPYRVRKGTAGSLSFVPLSWSRKPTIATPIAGSLFRPMTP